MGPRSISIIIGDSDTTSIVMALYDMPMEADFIDTGTVSYVLIQKATFLDNKILLTACQCESKDYFSIFCQTEEYKILSQEFLDGIQPVGRCRHQMVCLWWLAGGGKYEPGLLSDIILSKMSRTVASFSTLAIDTGLQYRPIAKRRGANYGKQLYAVWVMQDTTFVTCVLDENGLFKGLCCNSKRGRYCGHVRSVNQHQKSFKETEEQTDSSDDDSVEGDNEGGDAKDIQFQDLLIPSTVSADQTLHENEGANVSGPDSPTFPPSIVTSWLDAMGIISRRRYAGILIYLD